MLRLSNYLTGSNDSTEAGHRSNSTPDRRHGNVVGDGEDHRAEEEGNAYDDITYRQHESETEEEAPLGLRMWGEVLARWVANKLGSKGVIRLDQDLRSGLVIHALLKKLFVESTTPVASPERMAECGVLVETAGLTISAMANHYTNCESGRGRRQPPLTRHLPITRRPLLD